MIKKKSVWMLLILVDGGKCDVEFGVSKEIEVEYAMFLIQQYFDKHMDED